MSDKHDPEIRTDFAAYKKSGKQTDLRKAVDSLNAFYGTHLSSGERESLCKVITLEDLHEVEGGKFANLAGLVEKVRKNCRDYRKRDNFSFATKFAYFASGEKSPIFDQHVERAIKRRGYRGGRDFAAFYEAMASFSRQLGKNFHDLDDFLKAEGQSLKSKLL